MSDTIVSSQLLETPLFQNHQKSGAKLAPFAGFSMPMWFSSQKEEHLAVRNRVGCFDISHMGVYTISGSGALDFLQQLICNDVTKANNKMIYGMMLNQEGMILDDIMVGQFGGQFYLVVNGANKQKISLWMDQHKSDNVLITDMNTLNGFIAIQGPHTAQLLSVLYPNVNWKDIPRFGIESVDLNGTLVTVFRSGYTGEDGFEFLIPNDFVASIWENCCENGVVPCGLAARDTLRIEKGLPLYGQELSEQIHPLMTRYAWAVKWDTPFIGKEALTVLKDNPNQVTVGLVLEDRIIPRSHYKIAEGGEITSGTLSPMLEKPIAMAFVEPDYAMVGSSVTVMIRGKNYLAKVVSLPFC
ncbi:glycine cleavage system aminomethyltransferase GcvT [Candidatus Marinamargulisbacteria bacterium SCGC AG-410-N11]|nr:glycine cleavage system aminomethyltransferase GcvT [Candidatus Marinamargulisbacteria bacterium SCGC AG-410-N11]